jgi:hypothetical protein
VVVGSDTQPRQGGPQVLLERFHLHSKISLTGYVLPPLSNMKRINMTLGYLRCGAIHFPSCDVLVHNNKFLCHGLLLLCLLLVNFRDSVTESKKGRVNSLFPGEEFRRNC